MLAARRIAERFYEYVDAEGNPSENEEDFNIDASPHRVDEQVYEFDTLEEMVAAFRQDGVTFDSTGRADYAAEPDGSSVIDFATGERERVSWHLFPTMPMFTWLFLIAFVDARVDVRPNQYGGLSAVRIAGPQTVLRTALKRFTR